LLKPQLVGIGRASTFSGFCSFHDDKIFGPLEKESYSGMLNQCFLLGYRAIAKELYAKEAANSLAEYRAKMDYGRSVTDQILIQRHASAHNSGTQIGFRDIVHHKRVFDEVLVSGDLTRVRVLRVLIDGVFPIMASGAIYPERDFSGARLLDLSDLESCPSLMAFSLIFGSDCSEAVFTWVEDGDTVCERFVRSIEQLPQEVLPHSLVKFSFEFFENTHISPNWWDDLTDRQRDYLIRKWQAGIRPFEDIAPNCLVDDGMRLGDFRVLSVTRV